MKIKMLLPLLLLSALSLSDTQAATIYTLEINIFDQNANPIENRIGGLYFSVEGGDYGIDWNCEFDGAIPHTESWIDESYGLFLAVYDQIDFVNPVYDPIQSGIVLRISSIVDLIITDLVFHDYMGTPFSSDDTYFETSGFQASAVPEPATVFLTGWGLLAVPFFRKHYKNTPCRS